MIEFAVKMSLVAAPNQKLQTVILRVVHQRARRFLKFEQSLKFARDISRQIG